MVKHRPSALRRIKKMRRLLREQFSKDQLEQEIMGDMSIMDSTGDTKVIWDPDHEDEVDAAKAMFEKLIAKGFTAWSVGAKGEKAEKVKEWDPEVGSLIMVPRIAAG